MFFVFKKTKITNYKNFIFCFSMKRRIKSYSSRKKSKLVNRRIKSKLLNRRKKSKTSKYAVSTTRKSKAIKEFTSHSTRTKYERLSRNLIDKPKTLKIKSSQVQPAHEVPLVVSMKPLKHRIDTMAELDKTNSYLDTLIQQKQDFLKEFKRERSDKKVKTHLTKLNKLIQAERMVEKSLLQELMNSTPRIRTEFSTVVIKKPLFSTPVKHFDLANAEILAEYFARHDFVNYTYRSFLAYKYSTILNYKKEIDYMVYFMVDEEGELHTLIDPDTQVINLQHTTKPYTAIFITYAVFNYNKQRRTHGDEFQDFTKDIYFSFHDASSFFVKNNLSIHQNVLIIDNFRKTIERFEPHGQDINRFPEKHGTADYIIESLIKAFIPNLKHFKYYPPLDFCPLFSFQYLETSIRHETFDVGKCVNWSFYYLEMRLLNYNLSRSELFETMMQEFKSVDNFQEYITLYILTYSLQMGELARTMVKMIGDITGYEYTEDDIPPLDMHEFKQVYSNIYNTFHKNGYYQNVSVFDGKGKMKKLLSYYKNIDQDIAFYKAFHKYL